MNLAIVWMVRNCHELGNRWQTEEQMVRGAQVGHLKLDWLSAEIFQCTKNHIQPDASQWGAGKAGYDAVECRPTGL